jgi:hypothetical protein
MRSTADDSARTGVLSDLQSRSICSTSSTLWSKVATANVGWPAKFADDLGAFIWEKSYPAIIVVPDDRLSCGKRNRRPEHRTLKTT